MNADVLFAPLLDRHVLASIKIEKLLHKILYNAWHQVNVQGQRVSAELQLLLRWEIGFDYEAIDRKLDYFVHEARHYTPSYSVGSDIVESLVADFGLETIPLLFMQHSVHTLEKVRAALRAEPLRHGHPGSTEHEKEDLECSRGIPS